VTAAESEGKQKGDVEGLKGETKPRINDSAGKKRHGKTPPSLLLGKSYGGKPPGVKEDRLREGQKQPRPSPGIEGHREQKTLATPGPYEKATTENGS